MSMPYYKRYPSKFFRDTMGMHWEEKSIYGLVLDLIYMTDNRLVDDSGYISGLLGCSKRKWTSIRDKLIEQGKLQLENGIISNFQADKIVEERRKYRDKQVENGSKPKKNKRLKKPPLSHKEEDRDKEIPEAKASEHPQPEFELESPKVDEVRLAYDAYVQTAIHLRDQNHGRIIWPIPNTLTEKRRGHINARLNEVGLKGWRQMLSLASTSEFLSKRPPRNFDLDWVSNPDNFTKISEGKYNDRNKTGNVTELSRARPEPSSGGSAFLDGAYAAADAIDNAPLPRRDRQELHRERARATSSFERGDAVTLDAHGNVVAG